MPKTRRSETQPIVAPKFPPFRSRTGRGTGGSTIKVPVKVRPSAGASVTVPPPKEFQGLKGRVTREEAAKRIKK